MSGSTFRELFDEGERDAMVSALQARLGHLEGRIKRLKHAERVTDASLKLDELEERRDELESLIHRVCDECN